MTSSEATLSPMFLRIVALFLTGFLVVGSLSSCGYKFVKQDRRFLGKYDLVAVPVFVNKTEEVSVERFFTNSLIREINRSKAARVVPKDRADVEVRGEILNIRYVSGAPVSIQSEVTLNTSVTIVVQVGIGIYRIADDEQIWANRISGSKAYLAPRISSDSINSANALYNHSARLQNLEILSQDMMREAFDRIMENF